MKQLSEELLAAYLATTYTARLGELEVRIRVGSRCPSIDRELAERNLLSLIHI